VASWAIVIGVNEYWNPAVNLHGAVEDALKMSSWLTSQEGGNVPPQNLYLLTRPTPPPSATPLHPRIVKRDATYDSVVESGIDLVNKSGGKGERLFFYFSGHGLINRRNFTDESVIALADFSNVHPENSVTISSVREYFGNTAFNEQFFFFDACRNMLDWQREFRVGEFPFPGEPDPARLQNVAQFVLSATSPRLRAVELNERGAFTEILLAGLGGAGKAKIYDKDNEEYVVRADRLFAYVEKEVRKKKILVTEPPARALYQRVYPEFKNVTVYPTLARIPRAAVKPEKLQLYVKPDGVWTQTTVKVRVTSEDAEYDEEITPVTGVPVELPPVVLPMSYTARAEASGFEPERRRWPFDLYDYADEPYTLELRLNPLKIVAAGGTGTGSPPVDGSQQDAARNALELAVGTGSRSIFKGIDTQLPTATLIVKSSDPLAPIEVYDNKGELKAEGQGEVVVSNLDPGFYRARLVTPEGSMAEELVGISAGETEEVPLDTPNLPNQGLFKEIVEHTDFHPSDEDGTLRFSEYVGPMATPQLTTVLALAGSIVVQQYGWGDKTVQLGLLSFKELTSPTARNGLRVIFADEALHTGGDSGYLSKVKLRFWLQSDETGPARTEKLGLLNSPYFAGLADFAREVEPGAYVLELSLPERPPVYLSLAVLPERLTLLVLHRQADGGLRIFSYAPSAGFATPAAKDAAIDLRRLDLLQRFYLSDCGNEKHIFRNAIELLHAKWLDPLAGCLGSYTMLKLGQAQELNIAVNNMLRHYGELSDSHVLAAEHFLAEETEDGRARAQQFYEAALDRGLPVFAEGLLRLASGIERFAIQHPRAHEVRRVFGERARHLLWTAWTVQDEATAGAPGE
jgi:hypothetical protein